jgi:hypothetical protein
MKEKRNGSHGDGQAVFLARPFEVADDSVALRRRSVHGNEIIVVKINSPGAYFTQHGCDFNWQNRWAHEIAKRITAAMAHGPESKGKLVFRFWLKWSRAHQTLPGANRTNTKFFAVNVNGA